MGALNPGILHEMVERLAREFDPEAIILFGSHAWGDPGEDSDVDLLVVVSGSALTPTRRAVQARKCLRGIRVPKDVLVKTRDEMVRFSEMPASFERKVLDRGRVLYERRQRA